MPKITVPLDQRVCKRGHVGQYRKRANATVCYECQKLAQAKFQASGKTSSKRLPLEERVCKYGHAGSYARSSQGTPFCRECGKDAIAKYHSRSSVDSLRYERQVLESELARVNALIAQRESGA
jgi:hypothetical protein